MTPHNPATLTKNDLKRYPHLADRVNQDDPGTRDRAPVRKRAILPSAERMEAGTMGWCLGVITLGVLTALVKAGVI